MAVHQRHLWIREDIFWQKNDILRISMTKEKNAILTVKTDW